MDSKGLIYCNVKINGISRVLLLDTGASISILKKYCVKPTIIDAKKKIKISGVCGHMISEGDYFR